MRNLRAPQSTSARVAVAELPLPGKGCDALTFSTLAGKVVRCWRNGYRQPGGAVRCFHHLPEVDHDQE